MDLCADQLFAQLRLTPNIEPTDLETPFRRRFQRLPLIGRRPAAFNADRIVNRHLVLPKFVRRCASDFDFIHIVDHSYAHLALSVPPGRAGVYCHDLDAFRSLLEPEREPRPLWFRWLARRTLCGLKAAAVVFHNSQEVGLQLLKSGLVASERLVHAPLGVAEEFTAEASKPIRLPDPGLPSGPLLLHVGSHIPRKRIDVLLEVFAAVRERNASAKLVQVGPPFSRANVERIERMGIGKGVQQFRNLTREQLAELYRRSAVVLVPSEAEGFGLPAIEALACGAAVVASDIPVLREVGGEATIYAPVGDISAWTAAILRVLAEPGFAPSRALRLSQAARYTWGEHARTIVETYRNLLNSTNRTSQA